MREENRKQPALIQHILVVVPLWAWTLLSIGLILLLSLIIYAFFGSIPITVQGKGIVIPKAGLYNIQAPIEGTVLHIGFRPGEIIKKGQLLMNLYDPQMELKYQEAKSRVLLLNRQLTDLKQEIKKEERAYKNGLKIKRDALNYSIAELEEQIKFLNQESQSRENLVEKGLISPMLYNQALQNIAQKKIDLQSKIGAVAEINSEIKKEYRANEIIQKEQQVREAGEEERLLKASLDQGNIYSNFEGRVLEVLANVGDLVKIGEPLFWIVEGTDVNVTPQKSEILGFFKVEEGKRIQIGKPIKMRFPNINYNQYGSLTGVVKNISLYAVSQAQLYNKIHNKTLIDYLIGKSPAVIEVAIEPDLDPNKKDLFLWTSRLQPPFPITFGAVGDIDATVEEVRPIFYLIPLSLFKY